MMLEFLYLLTESMLKISRNQTYCRIFCLVVINSIKQVEEGSYSGKVKQSMTQNIVGNDQGYFDCSIRCFLVDNDSMDIDVDSIHFGCCCYLWND